MINSLISHRYISIVNKGAITQSKMFEPLRHCTDLSYYHITKSCHNKLTLLCVSKVSTSVSSKVQNLRKMRNVGQTF